MVHRTNLHLCISIYKRLPRNWEKSIPVGRQGCTSGVLYNHKPSCLYCFISSVDGLGGRRYILQGVTSHAGPTMKTEAVTSLLQALLSYEIFNHVSTKCHYRSNNVHIIYHLPWDLSTSLFILSNLGWKKFFLLYRQQIVVPCCPTVTFRVYSQSIYIFKTFYALHGVGCLYNAIVLYSRPCSTLWFKEEINNVQQCLKKRIKCALLKGFSPC